MTTAKVKPKLYWLETLVRLLDDQFRIPGTKFRFGLDPLLGLIPFLGEASTFLISGGLLLQMAKKGASGKVVTLMVLNLLADSIMGSIPIIGNIFDFFFKANRRNIDLLKEHYEQGKHQGSGKGLVIIVLLVLFILFALFLYGLWKLTVYVFSFFT